MNDNVEKKDMYIVPIKLLMGLSIVIDKGLKNDELQKAINEKVEATINEFIPDEDIKKIMYDLSVAFSKKMKDGSGIIVPATYRAVNNDEDSQIVSEFMKTLNDNINKAEQEVIDGKESK
jgi:cell division protein YceG involved in septum cleavage